MSRITPVNQRKLVKDYHPKEPPVTRAVRFEGFNIRWGERHRRYLIDNYPDCESEKIADILNCDVREVAEEARRLHLQKSAKFKLWWQEHRLGIRRKDVEAPQGYHWETETEMNDRLERESMADARAAEKYASTFDFCNRSEKKYLTAVLIQALKWHRSTIPQTIDKEV